MKARIFLLLLPVLAMYGCKRQASITVAEETYQYREYFVSADLYKQAYKSVKDKNEKFAAAFGAAKSYKNINEYRQAETWFVNALKYNPDHRESLLGYALELKGGEKYEEAILQFKKYAENGGSVTVAARETAGCELALKSKNNPVKYVVIPEKSLNTANADYAPAIYRNGMLLFTSDRPGGVNDKMYRRTGAGHSDMYVCNYKVKDKDRLPSFSFTGIKLLPDLNTPMNDGTCVFDKKNNKLYFTICNGSDDKGSSCKIYVSALSGNKWSVPAVLDFCIDSVNYGHPALSPDGLTMYFSSDREGGHGGHDLYAATWSAGNKTWSAPFNLGTAVNTEQNELYPSVAPDGTLYFSSTGHTGFGGLDIFISRNNGGDWEQPVNAGYPINSGRDDFGMVFNEKEQSGFLTSNREGGKGNDDIYSFYKKPVVLLFTGIVKDAKTGELITDATASIRVKDSVFQVTTDRKGSFSLPLLPGMEYSFVASKVQDYYYDSQAETVNTLGIDVSQDFSREFLLSRINVEDEFTIKGIYYDVDKADIRSESETVLDSLVLLLNKYPRIRMEIGSHTDCRSAAAYNITLSQKRAESVVNYLVSKNINAGRLEAKGYGESRLVNDCGCENGVVTRECGETEHQQNRRTTFRIISK